MGSIKATLSPSSHKITIVWSIVIFSITFFGLGITLAEAAISELATVKQKNENTSTLPKENPIVPQPANVLILGPPAFVPAAVTLNEPTPVRFAAVASGVTQYPSALELQEFDPESGQWKKVPEGNLGDDGRNGDLVAGDHIYARKLMVTGTQAGEKRYRVVSIQKENPVESKPRALPITRFPVGAAQGKFMVIRDEKSSRKFVAEQVTVRFIPSVSEERMQDIVEKATGGAGHVIGYLPQIRLVQVGLELASDATKEARVAAVYNAVKEFTSYDEVRHAQPNFTFKFAQSHPDGATSAECENHERQWGADKIQAPQAWDLMDENDWVGAKLVAVVDTGVKPSIETDGDLCWGESNRRSPASCNPVNVLGDEWFEEIDPNNQQDYAEHGTRVAGIIAARHHDSDAPFGISGIAHGRPIISFDVGHSLLKADGGVSGDGITRASKILESAAHPEVGIINISVGDPAEDTDFKCALQRATCDPDASDEECRCEDDDVAHLVVVAAGNLGTVGDNPYSSYPCAWELDAVLCVANTDQADNLHNLSNYGPWVDLTAPGTQVCTTSTSISNNHSVYVAPSETSFAVPHVSGAAAVLWAVAADVANRLKCTADHISDMDEPEYAGKLGSGRLNLFKAVKMPVAENDLNTAIEGGDAVSGNVISNDDPGNAPATVTAATQGGSSIPLDGSDFATTGGGILTLTSEGVYIYQPPIQGSVPLEGLREEFNYTIEDACGDTAAATLTITVTNDNNPPVLAAIEGGALSYSEGDGAVALTASTTVSDVDDTHIESAVIQITGNYQNGQDVLAFTDTATITGSWDAGNGKLTLTGTDTLAHYQAALRAVTYANTSVSPSTASRTVTFTVNDGDADSNALTREIKVGFPDRLVLVLDKSGSMACSSHPVDDTCARCLLPLPANCEPSRWTLLTRAVEQMLAVAEPYTLPKDRFAVAFFDSNVDPGDQLGFIEFGQTFSDFVSRPDRTPGGSTSIGAGMTAFESDLIAGASDYHQTILLFTDGDQNVPPYLVTNDSQVLINPTAISPTGLEVYEFASGVSICPFALRADGGAGTLSNSYLQRIADLRCDGLMNSSMSVNPDDAALQMFFEQVRNKALVGDKLELLKVKSGRISRFGCPLLKWLLSHGRETFTTSRDDVAFTLLITWPDPGDGLKEIVLSKGGVDFPVTGTSNRIHIRSGDTYMAITLRQPYCNEDGKCVKSEGEWTLRMQPDLNRSDKFSYNLFVTADNASLASEFRVSQPEPGIGRPLRLTARFTEDGNPIQGLPPGSVRAFLSRPEESLGNVLPKAKVMKSAVSVKTSDDDPISEVGRIVAAMLADPVLRESILAALEPSVGTELILKEFKPGLYAADYTDTRVSGVYSVRFYVEGKSAGNGIFTRTFSSDRSVEVVVDEKATLDTVRVAPIPSCTLVGGCNAITLTPVDAAGNLLGPGKAGLINVTKDFGKVLGPISDQLDGSYKVKIGYTSRRYPAGFQKKLVIDIRGVKVPVSLGK